MLTPVLPSVFKGRYPEFTSVPDGVLAGALEEATHHVDESWIAGDQLNAMMIYAAHVLAVEGEPARSNSVANGTANSSQSPTMTGAVETAKVGDVSVTFAGGGTSKLVAGLSGEGVGDFAATPYGKRFLMLRARSFPTVVVA